MESSPSATATALGEFTASRRAPGSQCRHLVVSMVVPSNSSFHARFQPAPVGVAADSGARVPSAMESSAVKMVK